MSRRFSKLEVKVSQPLIQKNVPSYKEKQERRKLILDGIMELLNNTKKRDTYINYIKEVGKTDERYALGLFYYNQKNLPLAAEQFQAAVDREEDQNGFQELAQCMLAKFHQNGYSFPIKQPAEADRIFNGITYEEKSGVAVYPDACFQAAQFCYYGVQGKVDIGRALQLYTMAANAGHPGAQVKLAEISLVHGSDGQLAVTLLSNNKDFPETKPYLDILENGNLEERDGRLRIKAQEIQAKRVFKKNNDFGNSLTPGYIKILLNKLCGFEYSLGDPAELKSELKKIAQNEGQYKIDVSTPSQKYCLAIYYLQYAQKLKEIAPSKWRGNETERLDSIQSAIKLLESIKKSEDPRRYQLAQCKLAELCQQQPMEKLKFKGSTDAFNIYMKLAFDAKEPCPEALFQLGKFYQKSKNISEAFQCHWLAAQLGHSQALKEWLEIAAKDQNPYTKEANIKFAILLLERAATKTTNTLTAGDVEPSSRNRYSFHSPSTIGVELSQLPLAQRDKSTSSTTAEVACDLYMLP